MSVRRVSTRPPAALVGVGRLARAMLPGLVEAGYPVVAVVSRSPAVRRWVSRLAPQAAVTSKLAVAAADARLILLAVQDSRIPEVAEELARAPGLNWVGKTVLHHAGALGPESLNGLRDSGAAVGVMHPMQCFGNTPSAPSRWRGSSARIEGDAAACRDARRLARALGMKPLELLERWTPSRRATYHAAASLVSNDLLSLLDLAVSLLESLGLDRRKAIGALTPLATGTLQQLAESGFKKSLTGPVVRGDAETVASHLAALGSCSADAAEIHRLLSRRLLQLAESDGPVPGGKKVRQVLGSVRAGSGRRQKV